MSQPQPPIPQPSFPGQFEQGRAAQPMPAGSSQQPAQAPWQPGQAAPWQSAPRQPLPEVDLAAAATAARGRSLAPDLARGIMLLLIALANVPWWLTAAEHGATNAHGIGYEGADLIYQLVSLVVIDGRAYPLFAFLFGYGIWQMYSRQAAAGTPWRDARRVLQIRHGWMVAFGAVHALLLWFGDIVGAYGLVGLIVVGALLRRSDRTLVVVAWIVTGLLAVAGVMTLVSGLLLGSGAFGDASLFAITDIPAVAAESNYLIFMAASFGTWLIATPGQVIMLTVPLAVVLGVLAARRGLLDRPHEHRALLTRIAVGGILIGWAGGAVAALQFAGVLLDPAVSFATMGITGLAGVAGGIGYAALFGLLAAAIGRRGERRPHGIVTRAVSAVGKRSLTSYLLQSVLFAPVLAAWGFGLGATMTPLTAAGLAVGVWLVTAVVAVLLDLRGKRGPAEALLRRLAYGRRPVAAPTPVG